MISQCLKSQPFSFFQTLIKVYAALYCVDSILFIEISILAYKCPGNWYKNIPLCQAGFVIVFYRS